ncbi:hypothetical protein [Kordiimonas gwangyangensis]|uniref:hypothetical protein n=1 Tax=Kordiimonas gwangyangensis TaxID=288022 RepID=UPI00036F56E2|nr:hypothetical protein [Kordiimonas gwangyangensis]
MNTRKALARVSVPMMVADATAYVSVRRVLAENIAMQIKEGFSFELSAKSWDALDQILNSALRKEFRAPTPAQARFVAVIAKTLELNVSGSTYRNQVAAEAFIAEHYDAFKEIKALEVDEGYRW